jgi:hypothetical protein
MKALRLFETSGTAYPETLCNIPDDLNRHNHRCENLESYCLGLIYAENGGTRPFQNVGKYLSFDKA